MQENTPDNTNQIREVVATLWRVLGDALVAVYLHGSAVSGGLRPQSDLDLLVIIDSGITDDQRSDLLAALLHISNRHPSTPGGPRCVEVVVFRQSDLFEPRFPPRAEFTYGEWLRAGFETGERPIRSNDPEYTMVLAQARQQAIPLFGQKASKLLPEIPLQQIRQAMRDMLPELLEGLRGDERNVLLTLARIWRTASTGEFVPKNAAAAWAIPLIPEQKAATLDYARRAYLGEIVDDWVNRSSDAKTLAEHLLLRINELF